MKVESIYDIQSINQGIVKADKLKSHLNEGTRFQDILKNNIGIIENKSNGDNRNKDIEDKKLMNLCIQMESIFVARMLKEMRNTIHKSKLLHGGFAEEIFEDMLYDEYALKLSRSSNLGLAKMLYEELSNK